MDLKLIDRKIKLEAKLDKCKKVLALTKHEGWKTVELLIEKTIGDIDKKLVARKDGDIWVNGELATPKNIAVFEEYLKLFHYKQAVIDFSNRIMMYIKSIDGLTEEISKIVSPGRKAKNGDIDRRLTKKYVLEEDR